MDNLWIIYGYIIHMDIMWIFYGETMDNLWLMIIYDYIIYPLVICYIANWKMAMEIVSFPIKHGDFSIISYMLNYQRVFTGWWYTYPWNIWVNWDDYSQDMAKSQSGSKPPTSSRFFKSLNTIWNLSSHASRRST